MSLKRSQWPRLALVVLYVFGGISSHAEVLDISGSNTLGARLIPECGRAYLAERGGREPAVAITQPNEFKVFAEGSSEQFNIKAHGSSTGFRAVQAGQASIAMSSRPIKAKEVEILASVGNMRSVAAEHTVAVDGLAVLVHPSNPLNSLSTRQIAQIFSGEIRRWSELGGADMAIQIYAQGRELWYLGYV